MQFRFLGHQTASKSAGPAVYQAETKGARDRASDSQNRNARDAGWQSPTDASLQAPRREPWNKGKLIGAKPPLRPKHVWTDSR